MIDLRLGPWESALADVGEVSSVICDPPYSARVHEGHDAGRDNSHAIYVSKSGVVRTSTVERRAMTYEHWTAADVRALVDWWAPRNRGWFVCLSDNELCPAYREAFEANGLTGFAPVGILIPGMTVRMAGDGPSSWMLYANVARPKRLSKWGTLPGGYTGPPGERVHIGGKPLWLMKTLVRAYTKKNDLVCDPCMGAGTTGLAAITEGRRFVGAEVDPATFAMAERRFKAGVTPTFEAFQ